MSFLKGATFRIWLPYALVVFGTAILIGVVYPIRQKQAFIEHKMQQLTEIANHLTQIATRNLSGGNTTELDRAVVRLSDKSGVIIFVYYADTTASPVMVSQHPITANLENVKQDRKNYFTAEGSFRSTFIEHGNILVAMPTDQMNQFISELNYPIYIVLITAVLITTALFYFVSVKVSSPIIEITRFADQMVRGDYSQHLQGSNEFNEIGLLKNSLNNLRITLSKQNHINQQLTTDLEFQVSKRTHELHAALKKLNNSEKIAKIGNFQYWIETDVWEVSENITEILGIKSEDLTDMKSFLNVIRQETREKVDTSLQSGFLQKKRIEIDFTISERYRRGYQWATLIGEYHEVLGRGACFSGTIQDISERKKAEAEVHKLSLVARLINSGVILTDIEKKIIWANEGMQKLTGYTVNEMIGKTPRLFQSEKTDASTLARISQQLKLQQSIKVELQNIRKDGIGYWIELNIQPFWDEYENLSGYLAIQVDITERKRYEEELKKSLLRETDLNQMKSQFLSMASHELRTPLTSIQSSAELLAMQLEDQTIPIHSEKSKRHTSRIINEVTRLTSFMNDTLVLSKIEAGKVSFQPVLSDVPAIINEILEGKEVLHKDNRKISIAYSGNPRLVKLDPLLFSHIVINLASNALKYSKGKEAPKIEIEYHDELVSIHFIDYGIGIPPDDHGKLFQSFFRASNAESIQGSGLGLMIVKQFVELHQGELRIKSEVNVGTTITVELKYDTQRPVSELV